MHDFFLEAALLWRSLWLHRMLGLAVACGAGIVGALVVVAVPDRYEASARIYVDTQSILKPLMTGLAVQPNVEQQVMMLSRTLISRPNVEKLIRMADMDLDTGFRSSHDDLVDRVIRTLEIKSTSRDNLYTLSFRDPDPAKSKRVVSSLASIFVESSLGDKRQDSDSAKKFIDEQVGMYEKKLQDAELRLKDFRLRNVEMQASDGRGMAGQAADTGALLAQARLDLREAQNAREALRRQILGNSEGRDGEASAGATPELDSRIQAEQRNLDSLTQRYTERHPDVIGARRVLRELGEQKQRQAAVQRQAAAANPGILIGDGGPASQELKRTLAGADASVAGLATRVAEFESRAARMTESLKRMPEVEKEYSQLNRDYEINKKNYEGLVARRESATLSGEMEATAGVANFRLIDPPRVSPRPVYPNRALLLSAALALSLAAGVLAAFAAAHLRPVFFDADSLRRVTGLPLLGRVSMVQSPDDARRERFRLGLFFALSAAMLGLYGVGIALVFFRSVTVA